MIDPMTGEILSDTNIDSLLYYIMESEKTIAMMKTSIHQAKVAIYEKAEFGDSKTARVHGNKYKCKIEMPSKIVWDQKKLADIYWADAPYPYESTAKVVNVSTYKVNMREYKKLINTTGEPHFNKFKQDLMSANLGITGTPRYIIE